MAEPLTAHRWHPLLQCGEDISSLMDDVAQAVAWAKRGNRKPTRLVVGDMHLAAVASIWDADSPRTLLGIPVVYDPAMDFSILECEPAQPRRKGLLARWFKIPTKDD